MDDKEYRKEADQRGLPVGRAIGGAQLQHLIAQKFFAVPGPVVREYLSFTGIKTKE